MIPPVPDELLSRIFVHSLPPQPYVVASTADAPFQLMAVCRRWKNIAQRTPQLWSSLDALSYEYGDYMRKSSIKGYQTWLSRSGNCPISLALQFNTDDEHMEEWLNAVLPYRTRFLRLKLVDKYVFGVDLGKLLHDADDLRVFHLQHGWGRHAPTGIPYLPTTPRILILDQVDIRNAIIPRSVWTNLVNLTDVAINLPEEHPYQLSDFLELLLHCPDLNILLFSTVSASSTFDNPVPIQPLTHHALRCLTLGIEELPDLPALLILPNVHSLEILRGSLYDDLEQMLNKNHEDDHYSSIPPSERQLEVHMGHSASFHIFDTAWMNITHLWLTYSGHWNAIETTFKTCPNLRLFDLRSDNCSSFSTSLSTAFVYPSLEHLTLYVRAPLGNVLEMVTLPGLRKLCIIAEQYDGHDVLLHMLRRSQSPLEYFRMPYKVPWGWTEEQEDQLLALVPTLTTKNFLHLSI